MRYRPEIDGLRALAVVSVVLYHAGVPWLSGGFAGVDVFFVISGFLITGIISEQINSSGFSIIEFYDRRARRILPALIVMMIMAMPMSYYTLLPDDMKSFWRSILATCLFMSNFLFSAESGYFSPDVELKPLLHTWSLSVEEQFYVFYPFLIVLLHRYTKKYSFYILSLMMVLSFLYSDSRSITNPTLNFYNIVSRSWELLAGAMAYWAKERVLIKNGSILKSISGLLGLFLIIASFFWIDKSIPFPGRYALTPVVGAFLIICFCDKNNLPGKILSSKLLVGIGLISYSLYLWHQPLMALVRHNYVSEVPTVVMGGVVVASFVMAYLSYRFIEKPFRSKEFVDRKAVFKYSSASIACLIVVSVIGLNTSVLNRFEGNKLYSELNYRLRGNYGLSELCEKTFHDEVKCKTSETPEIIVWGDSYAMQIVPAIISSNPKVQIIQATISQCAPVLGSSYAKVIYGSKECINSNDRVFEYIKNTPSIKYVVLASPFEGLVNNGYILSRDGKISLLGSRKFESDFERTIKEIKLLGKTPVIIAPPIKNKNNDIGYCLMKTTLINGRVERCDFNYSDSPVFQMEVYKLFKSISKDTKVIWINDFTCLKGRCHASEDGILYYRDKGHLSFEGSEYLGKKYDLYKKITD